MKYHCTHLARILAWVGASGQLSSRKGTLRSPRMMSYIPGLPDAQLPKNWANKVATITGVRKNDREVVLVTIVVKEIRTLTTPPRQAVEREKRRVNKP